MPGVGVRRPRRKWREAPQSARRRAVPSARHCRDRERSPGRNRGIAGSGTSGTRLGQAGPMGSRSLHDPRSGVTACLDSRPLDADCRSAAQDSEPRGGWPRRATGSPAGRDPMDNAGRAETPRCGSPQARQAVGKRLRPGMPTPEAIDADRGGRLHGRLRGTDIAPVRSAICCRHRGSETCTGMPLAGPQQDPNWTLKATAELR